MAELTEYHDNQGRLVESITDYGTGRALRRIYDPETGALTESHTLAVRPLPLTPDPPRSTLTDPALRSPSIRK